MKLRWKFAYCILVASCIVASLANERPKRDLLKLKKLILSKFLRLKDMNSVEPYNYRLYRIPGFNNILVKAVPKETKKVVNVPITILQDKKANEPLKALEDIKKLLELGILNDKHDKIIQEIIVPMFQMRPIKFTTTEVTKTYSVKPSHTLIEVPEQIIVRNPPIEVTEVISIVPDDTKYSYKQITKDEEITTFVSQNSPNTVINTTKKVPRLPQHIKMRLQEVASMGVNPYAFARPGAVITARPSVLIEEFFKVPSVPQDANIFREPGAIDIYGSPVIVSGIRPYESRPIFVKENGLPAVSAAPTDFKVLWRPDENSVYTDPTFLNIPRLPVFVKETLESGGVLTERLIAQPPILVKETSYIPTPPSGVIDDFHQPIVGVVRPPVLVKETVKIPAFSQGIPSGVFYTPPLVVKEQRPPVLVEENIKVPGVKAVIPKIDTRGTVNIKVNSDTTIHQNGNRIPPPPSLSEYHSNTKETPGFSYRLLHKNEMNNFMNSVNTTKMMFPTTISNGESNVNKGTGREKANTYGIPPPPTLGSTNKPKRFSHDFVNGNQNKSTSNFAKSKLVEYEVHNNNNNRTKNESNGILPLSSFLAEKNITKIGSIDIGKTKMLDTIEAQTISNKIKTKNKVGWNKTTSPEEKYNNNVVPSVNILKKHFNSSFLNNSNNTKSVMHRGDIPSPPSLLSSEENSEESEITNTTTNTVIEATESNNSSTNITVSKIQSAKTDNKFVGVLSNEKILPPPLNISFTNKNGSSRGHIKFHRNDTNIADFETLETKLKGKETVVPPSSSLTEKLNETLQKDVAKTFSHRNLSVVESVDNTKSFVKYSPNTIKKPKTETNQDDKNQTKKNIPPPPTPMISRKNDSILNQKPNSTSNSIQISKTSSLKNRSHNVIKAKNGFNQFNSSAFNNKTSELNSTKSQILSEEKVDEELNNLRKNHHPTNAYIKAQTDLNQIENKVAGTSDVKNTSMKSINVANFPKKEELNSNSKNTLFGNRMKISSSKALNEENFDDRIKKINKTNPGLNHNKTSISNQNVTATSKLRVNYQRRTGGITVRSKPKQQITTTTIKGNHRKQDDKYALNPSRKSAINRLIGRNETTSNKLKSAATNSAVSRLSQKHNTKTGSNNRVAVNIITKTNNGKRSRRDLNNVYYRIPNHYLYVPPIDVDIPPPIRTKEFDKVQKDSDRTSETLNNLGMNNIKANSLNNPIIVRNANSYIFRRDNIANSSDA